MKIIISFSLMLIFLIIFTGIYYLFINNKGYKEINENLVDYDKKEDNNEGIDSNPNNVPGNKSDQEQNGPNEGTVIFTNPLLMINDSDVRVNETFSIWIDENDEYYSDSLQWDFNDGTLKVGSNVDHFFSSSKIYNIKIIYKNGNIIANIDMKIKNKDEVFYTSEEGFKDYRYNSARGGRLGGYIKDGISEPIFIFNISINGASGKVGISIDVFDDVNSKLKNIYYDIQIVLNEDLFYHQVITVNDYKIIDNPDAVAGGPIIEEGKCSSFEITVFIYY